MARGEKNKARRAPTPTAETRERATKERVAGLIQALHDLYPDAHCELHHESPLQLLVATILSAQSTDRRVNQVSAELFRKYRSAEDFAAADPDTFAEEIRSTGFYRNKTRSVLGAARRLVEVFGGEVPQTLQELVTLPGVARKTANVVLGTAFGKPTGVVVDTHIRRLAQRLGLSTARNPDKIEADLMEILPQEEWIYLGHALIWHGRRVCHARKPACSECTLAELCPQVGVGIAG